MGEYLASAGAGAGGVVVVHDWCGQLPHVRARCDDLAAAGFTAVAVDLYDGASTASEDEAEQLRDALDWAGARFTVEAAVRRLRGAGISAPRIGAVGFSIGGRLVLESAIRGAFDAVAAYDGVLRPEAAAPIPCPVLLQVADAVDWDPPDLPERFAEAVAGAGGIIELKVYAYTEHAFANADVPAFNPSAAASAWEDTVAFLRDVVG